MPVRIHLLAAAIILAPLALASCGPHESKPVEPQTEPAAPPPAATPTPQDIEATYNCPPGRTIAVTYHNAAHNDATPQTATVTVDNQSYTMTITSSASGARYTTSEGRAPGLTLTWWTKGDEAQLLEGKTDGSIPEKQIASCSDNDI